MGAAIKTASLDLFAPAFVRGSAVGRCDFSRNSQNHPLIPKSWSGPLFGVKAFPTSIDGAFDNESVSGPNGLLGVTRVHRSNSEDSRRAAEIPTACVIRGRSGPHALPLLFVPRLLPPVYVFHGKTVRM